jgi:PAS domain S-box-containing protein
MGSAAPAVPTTYHRVVGAFSFDRKYLVGLGVALLVFVALSAAGWQSIQRQRAAMALARETTVAQQHTHDILHALLLLESSQRSYLLTTEARQRELFDATRLRLESQLQALAAQEADHPQQAAHLAALGPLVRERIAALARAMDLRDARGLDSAAHATNSQGQEPVARIGELLARIDHEDARRLAAQEAAADAAIDQNLRLALAAAAAGALLLLAIYGLLRRELAARQRAALVEAEHRDQLEREIDARTGELRTTADALAVSEARLRGIFDSATDAILTVDESQRVVMANPAAARMLGLPLDELVGAALDRFIPEPSRQRHAEFVRAFGASGSAARPMSPQREVAGRRADGTELPIEAAISHVHIDGQRLYTVILRDIAERKRAETALRDSEARLRRLLALLPEAVLVHTGGRVSFVNETAQRLFGADESALLGRPLRDLVPPDSVEPVKRRIATLEAGAVTTGLTELRVRRLDGSIRDVEATGVRLDLHGEVSVLSLMRDITETRRTQLALHRSEARFRDVLMDLPEPIFIRSDNHVSFINRAALELFGVADESDVLGRSPLDFCAPQGRAAAKERIDAVHHEPAVRLPPAEASVHRPDGAKRMVEVVGAPVEFQGKTSVIVMLRDVTELRRAQHALAGSHADLQRLVSRQDRVQEDERKRIARELHDDLQQKVAAILMNLSAARAQVRRDPASAERALAAADELAAGAIDSTRRIVNDLRPQVLDDLGLVAAIEALCAQVSRTSGLSCRVQAQPEASERAAASPALATCLYRVAQESLNNAIKHARARNVRIELAIDADQALVLRVHDDGRGLAAGARAKPGSFGLLGMHERLRMHGGTLRVDSRPGAGTTLEAAVPEHAADAEEATS